jgi:hypothetical protein
VKRADVAPRFAGWLDHAAAQEGIVGYPAAVTATSPSTAPSLPWLPEHAGLAEGLCRLAAATAQRSSQLQLTAEVDLALTHDLPLRVRKLVVAARQECARMDSTVLQHGDLSAQNWLVNRSRFSGIVDWEFTNPHGTPGFDMLNAMVALLEHGIGLRRWSESLVVSAFSAAWSTAPLFVRGRDAARRTASAAGVRESQLNAIEVAFFARRLSRRLRRPTGYATGPAVAAQMLEVACAS